MTDRRYPESRVVTFSAGRDSFEMKQEAIEYDPFLVSQVFDRKLSLEWSYLLLLCPFNNERLVLLLIA